MKTQELLLIGGGGHCRSVIDVIEAEGAYRIAGIVDKRENIGNTLFDYPIIAADEDLPNLFREFKFAFISIGFIYSNEPRVRLYLKLKEIGFTLPVLISPFSYVSKHAKIGEGTIIMHHALVNANSSIGVNCIINSKALIEHDAIIEDQCHISTAAVVNGGVHVKRNTFYGSNATSKQGITVEGFVKAGSIAK